MFPHLSAGLTKTDFAQKTYRESCSYRQPITEKDPQNAFFTKSLLRRKPFPQTLFALANLVKRPLAHAASCTHTLCTTNVLHIIFFTPSHTTARFWARWPEVLIHVSKTVLCETSLDLSRRHLTWLKRCTCQSGVCPSPNVRKQCFAQTLENSEKLHIHERATLAAATFYYSALWIIVHHFNTDLLSSTRTKPRKAAPKTHNLPQFGIMKKRETTRCLPCHSYGWSHPT